MLYAPTNVMPAEGGGRAWCGDLTFFKNLQSNSLPTSKSFQSNATKFPHPRLHIAVNPKAEPKKGTIKISPSKTLQSFINVAASAKIHVPVTAAIIRFNHNPCYTTGNPGSGIVPQYGSSKITVFVWGKNIILKFLANTK